MKGKILLVTTTDEAYHQPLLESQGYSVDKFSMAEALAQLSAEPYQLILVTQKETIDHTLAFCNEVRSQHPTLRIVLVADRSDHVPISSAVDTLIRGQGTPAQFLAIIEKEVEATTKKRQAASVPYEPEDE